MRVRVRMRMMRMKVKVRERVSGEGEGEGVRLTGLITNERCRIMSTALLWMRILILILILIPYNAVDCRRIGYGSSAHS